MIPISLVSIYHVFSRVNNHEQNRCYATSIFECQLACECDAALGVNLERVVYAMIVMCLSHHINYLIDEAVVSHFHSHYHKAWCTLSLQLHYNEMLLVKHIVFSFPAL